MNLTDYFYVDGDIAGAEDKISYGSGYPDYGAYGLQPQPPPTLTDRISEAVFRYGHYHVLK